VPAARGVPLQPFLRDPGLICEIKRRSPSRGDIDAGLDPVDLAAAYRERGVRSVSVLTEENHFAGSLADLIAVKQAYPDLAVLRKDFLLDEEDLEISFRAGADAVLLIASILDEPTLRRLHDRALGLGMAALVELHEPGDFVKGRAVRPELVGINARNLADFSVDLLTPIRLRTAIDWPHRAVFESGAFTHEDGLLVSSSGFDGLLVGEAAVRDQDAIPGLIAGLRGEPVPASGAAQPVAAKPATPRHAVPGGSRPFWSSIGELLANRVATRPLVKICGITNRDDARLAAEQGADLLGFVFADSPRRASADVVRECSGLGVLRVAVVVTGSHPETGEARPLPHEVVELIAEGQIDAVQFHGDEAPDECASQAFPYYKALRPGTPEAVRQIAEYRSPRVLLDARSAKAYGGTGTRIDDAVLRAAQEYGPLWIAGGLSDENIGEIARQWEPELVDVSSGLEAEAGRKDHERVRRFFAELAQAGESV
jgi:indole-3-glycerol phosphate synthase/phosphoribosylanthranilate isomerase